MRSDLREKELANKINYKSGAKVRVQRDRRLWTEITSTKLLEMCRNVKGLGFDHLSAISVTDLLKEGKYVIAYHLWSYHDRVALTIKTEISRKDPVIGSVVTIWGKSAQIHERESHEMFGVKFTGNPDLSELFLENWKGLPPFRRDFEWRAYVRKEHYHRENDRERGYWEADA
jgi:NADH-quinone oxidoreductase subunit C